MLLVITAMVMIWRLSDLVKKKGRWSIEKEQDSLAGEGEL
jgi:hypothetical protein